MVSTLKDVLIYSEKSHLPKVKPSKIKTLDSRFRWNNDFFHYFPNKKLQ